MFRTILWLLAASTLITPTVQSQIKVFGGPGERKSTWIVCFAGRSMAGSYGFTYGSPVWMADYEKHVKSDKDGSMRLGKDDWAKLDTSVALTIGGTKLSAGCWYLALNRTNGKLNLLAVPAKIARTEKIGPWAAATASKKILVPLTHTATDDATEHLSITTPKNEGNPGNSTFVLRWGKHKLTAPIVAHLKSSDSDKKKGAR